MITLGALSQGGQQGLVQAHGDDLAGPVAGRFASAPAKAVDVVALLRLIGPAVDVLLGDGLALDCLHTKSVIRKSELVETSARVAASAAARLPVETHGRHVVMLV